MSFNISGQVGTDEIHPAIFGDNDVFMEHPNTRSTILQMGKSSNILKNKVQSRIEPFVSDLNISNDTIMIMLLFVLIIMCSLIYTNVRQTNDSIRLLMAIVMSNKSR